MDGFPEYKALQKRLEVVEREVGLLRNDIASLQARERDTQADLSRMVLLTIGDEDLGLAGLLERMKSIEERPTNHRVLMLGLAVTSLTGLATFVVTLFQIATQ